MASDVINPCPKIDGSLDTATAGNSTMANTHCAGCENHCITIDSLKTDIQSKEEKILKLTSHVHQLETDAPTTNKKRRYGDVGKDDMNEAMIVDSADKLLSSKIRRKKLKL